MFKVRDYRTFAAFATLRDTDAVWGHAAYKKIKKSAGNGYHSHFGLGTTCYKG